jgi:Dolichyl-phosphate-mannose-protein mannosyltransferase
VSREAFLRRPLPYWICWGAILLLAVLFRVVPIRSGLPYSDYIDEGHVLHQTIDAMNRRSLDVYWYGLPALPAYTAGAALLLYNPFYRHFHGHGFQKDLPREHDLPTSRLDYDFIAPMELIVAGRIATACLSIASVILTGIIAARLMNRQAGLLAMLLVAVCPALVTRASIVIVDTFAAFFVLLVFYFSERILSGSRESAWKNVALSGLAAGLACASKYPAAVAGIAVIASIFLLDVSWAPRLRLLIAAATGFFLGIFVGGPMTFLQPGKVWRDIVANVQAYGWIHSPQSYFAQAISISELGWPLLLVGCAGLIFMLWRRRTRDVAIGWILFGIILIALFAGKSFQPFRSFLPLVFLLCIAAAIALASLIGQARSGSYRWLREGVAVLLIAGCVGSPAFASFRQVRQRMAHQDSRVQAVDWLQQHVGKHQRVLAIKELAILPSEWKRVQAKMTVVPLSEAAPLLHGQLSVNGSPPSDPFDYLVTGQFDAQPAADDRSESYRQAWTHEIAPLKVLATFGSVATPIPLNLWRTNDERLVICAISQ